MHTRTFKDSGNKNLINSSTITAGSIFVFDVNEKFKPYEFIEITNSSAEDIKIGTNFKNDFNFLVMAGDTRILRTSCEDIRLLNIGSGTIGVNEIQITLRHTGEVEKSKIRNKLELVSQFALIKNIF